MSPYSEHHPLFEEHPGVMLLVDPETLRIADANPAASAFYGYPRSTLQGMSLERIHTLDRAELLRFCAGVEAGDISAREFQHRVCDGSLRTVRTRPAVLHLDGQRLVLCMVEDVTGVRRAQAERVRAELLLEATFEAAPVAVLAVDLEGRVVLWSRGAERLFGWRREEVLGRPNPTVPRDIEVAYRKELGRLYREQTRGHANVPALCRDGSLIEVSVHTAPLHCPEGGVEGVVGVLQDVSERRVTRQALRDAGEAYSSLLNSLLEAVAVMDEEGRFLDVNEALVRSYGYPRGELIGQTPEFFAAPGRNDLAGVRRAIRSAYEGVSAQLEFWGRRGSGEVFPQEVVLTAATYWGAPAVIAVARDVTERKEAEDALRASEQRLRALVENVTDLVTVLDADSGVTFQNPAVERMLGYSRVEWYGRRAYDLVHPDDRERVASAFAEVLAHPDRPVRAELRFRHADGSWRPMETVATNRLADPAIRGIVVTSRDLSERQEAELALRESELRYRLMVEGSEQVFFYVHDRDGILQYLSPSVAPVLGYEPAELVGASYERLLTGDPLDEVVAARTGATLAGEISFSTYMVRIRHRGGRAVMLELTEAPVVRAGEIVGVQGFARDITARMLLEEQLRQAQKMEAIGRLAGGVAHDFNNLLTAVHGHAELALAELPAAAAARVEIAEVQAAAQRAAALTRQLLAFSRKQVLQPAVVAVDEVVQGLDRMLRRLIGEDIFATSHLNARGAEVLVDRGQLEQTIVNLVLNARDALGQGGTLEIATGCQRLDDVVVHDTGTLQPGEYVQIRVTDTGSGIAPDVLPLIWEPFFTTKEQGRGTGLGLSTVYGIVQQSGGTISVTSELGVGTTFTIWLPLCTGAERPATHVEQAAAPVRRYAKVLLVEDEPTVRTLAQRLLEHDGLEVLTAASGTEALEFLDERLDTLDAVISDIVMPGLSGIALAQRLRERRPELPILLMSGYSDQAIENPAVQAPGQFLAKPFTGPELIARVRALLQHVPV